MSFLSKLFGPPVPSIDAAALQAKLNEKPKPFVLDVREPSEYSAGHIAGRQPAGREIDDRAGYDIQRRIPGTSRSPPWSYSAGHRGYPG